MKKILALTLSLVLMLALCACGGGTEPAAPAAETAAAAPTEEAAPAEPAAEETYKVTFSTGEVYDLPAGDPLVFFFQCDAPGDMGAPNPGEEGAGITVSQGTVTYSNVGLGGPNQYPTSELVTVTGITGDVTVTVTDAASAMDATHTIYFDEQEIADAIAFAEEMAAQMAANPMGGSGEASGEASGEGSGSMEASGDVELTIDGVTAVAHFEESDNGDMATKGLTVTFDGETYTGEIDKGVYTADDEAAQPIFDALQAARSGVGPQQ